jgi:hypothetical protein
MHNITYYECLLLNRLECDRPSIAKGLNIIEITKLLQRWYHENSWELTGSYWELKGHPVSSKGDHRDRVHSDQMVLAMIRQGRLVR